jgi:hypothetical protein
MTVVLVVGAIAVVGAIVVGATWHRSADERQSVKNYHETLETLRHLSDRNAGGALRRRSQVSADGAGSQDPSEPEVLIGRSGVPQAGDTARTEAATETGGRRNVVFGDDLGGNPLVTPAATVSELASRRTLYQQRSPAHAGIPSRPGRRSLVAVLAAVVVAAAAVSAAVIGTSSPTHKPAVSSSHSAPPHRTGPSTRAGSSPRPKGASGNRPVTVQPTASSTTAASYSAPAGTYTVELAASGPCWVLATDMATGQVLWTGTLQADGQQQIQATGSLHVRLGAAFDVAVALDGSPVVLPQGHLSPFDLTFEAA